MALEAGCVCVCEGVVGVALEAGCACVCVGGEVALEAGCLSSALPFEGTVGEEHGVIWGELVADFNAAVWDLVFPIGGTCDITRVGVVALGAGPCLVCVCAWVTTRVGVVALGAGPCLLCEGGRVACWVFWPCCISIPCVFPLVGSSIARSSSSSESLICVINPVDFFNSSSACCIACSISISTLVSEALGPLNPGVMVTVETGFSLLSVCGSSEGEIDIMSSNSSKSSIFFLIVWLWIGKGFVLFTGFFRLFP